LEATLRQLQEIQEIKKKLEAKSKIEELKHESEEARLER